MSIMLSKITLTSAAIPTHVSDETVEQLNKYSVSCSIGIMLMISVSYSMAIFFDIGIIQHDIIIAMILVLYDMVHITQILLGSAL